MTKFGTFILPFVIILALVLVGGCTTTPPPPVEKIVIKEVPVAVHSPCPEPGKEPTQPKRVADEHPTMPVEPKAQALILAAKVLEWITYGERAHGVMAACSAPR